MNTSFVCKMDALSETQRTRYQEMVQNLEQSRQSIKELADGYAFRFKAEAQMIQDAAEFIVYERLCCQFLDFERVTEQYSNRL